MTLQFGGKCIKYLLFPFNLLFMITGIILIVVGAVIKTPYSFYHYILEHGFFAIPVLLIFIGVITFFVSFFGCYGALKENYCMVLTFGVMLVIIFILEISGGIAGYVLRDNFSGALKDNIRNAVQLYNQSNDVKNMLDFIQTNFHCCAALNVTDWNGTMVDCFCPPTDGKKIPCTPETTSQRSCYEVLKSIFTSNAGTLGGAGIGIAIIQVLGILFSYSLAASIRKQYESLEKD